MISLRENLEKIGVPRTSPFSYRSLHWPSETLRGTMRCMDFPKIWTQKSDLFRNEYWTDEVQGVAWDGENWIFSCNANQKKPTHNDKSIYVFQGGSRLKDDQWKSHIAYKDVPHPIADTKENDDHWGQLTYHEGFVYVSHWWKDGPRKNESNVVVFSINDGVLNFFRWITLEKVITAAGEAIYPEFQGINPNNGFLYSLSNSNPSTFYMHNTEDGSLIEEKPLRLRGLLPERVQGAYFSPNSHLYVSVDARLHQKKEYKWIFCYSTLNGQFLTKIPVLAEEDNQELQGLCGADVKCEGGGHVQMHVVLLENRRAALDNIFFKSFSADMPELV